jgi:hypothetical protein
MNVDVMKLDDGHSMTRECVQHAFMGEIFAMLVLPDDWAGEYQIGPRLPFSSRLLMKRRGTYCARLIAQIWATHGRVRRTSRSSLSMVESNESFVRGRSGLLGPGLPCQQPERQPSDQIKRSRGAERPKHERHCDFPAQIGAYCLLGSG